MTLYLILLLMLEVARFEVINEPKNNYQPEQVHLAYGYSDSDIVVTWSTFNDTESVVKFGISKLDQQAAGNSTVFVDGGKEKRPQWIHRAAMKDLDYDTTYMYQVGSEHGWSKQFSFKTLPGPAGAGAGPEYLVRAAVYGDLGFNNSLSLPYLKKDVEAGMYDMILHLGDFAYDMDEQEGRVGDDFMNLIEPIAASLPYMTCPGNHESAYNFSHYKSRFTMPGRKSNLYYSFDVGAVHIVSLSTEVYYFTQYGMNVMVDQYAWLRHDLAMVRAKQKDKEWLIIVVGHRPMYCSNDDPECRAELTRKGFLGLFGLEPLLKEFGVDLVIWAHEHSYERTWPLYDNKVYNGSYDRPYYGPRAPVHVVTGSAGSRECTDHFKKEPRPWSAFRSSDYGYTRLTVYNYTTIHIEQVSVEHVKGAATVVDSFWIQK